MNRLHLFSLLTVFLSFFFFPVCALGSPKLKLVATIFPLADVAREIGGESVTVDFLLPPGANPHTFEPTPKQMVNLQNTDLLIKVGFGFESWLEKIFPKNHPPLSISAASQEVTPIGNLHSDNHDNGHHHDPHVWLDPLIMTGFVKRLEQALIAKNPQQAAVYKHLARDYLKRLSETDRELKQIFAGLKAQPFIIFHSAWSYWFRHYSLKPTAVAEEFPGQPISAKKLISLIKTVRKRKVKSVFVNVQESPKTAGILAQETGITLYFLDPQGGPEIKGRSSYLELLKYNGRIFQQALQ